MFFDNPVLLFLFSLYIIIALLDYLDLATYFQLKEYRWDRIKDFYKTRRGKFVFWRLPNVTWRFFLILLIVLLVYLVDECRTRPWENPTAVCEAFLEFIRSLKKPWGLLLIIILFALDFLYYTYLFIKKKILRPRFTFKAVAFIFGALAIEIFLYVGGLKLIYAIEDYFVRPIYLNNGLPGGSTGPGWLMSLSFLALYLLFFVILFRGFYALSIAVLLSIPTKILKSIYISRATHKLSQYKNLRRVGITGSYGKTSVKTYLTHILKDHHKVIQTPKNINTEIGVAKFILQTNFSKCDIFVVEMGAYRVGEIKIIADMVKPEVGILTTIAPQHLSLFGSIEAIQKTKYELLRSLPKKGLAITNSDNKYCRSSLKELDAKVLTFGTKNKFEPNVYITKARGTSKGVTGEISYETDTWTIEAPVYGKHQLQNIAPCIIAAEWLGMSKNAILRRVATLPIPNGTLRVKEWGTATVIDDSYNANPDGFIAALDVASVLKKKDQKVVVVTRGMLELGEKAQSSYNVVAEKINSLVDELILIDAEAVKFFEKSSLAKSVKVHEILDKDDQKKKLLSYKKENAIILLENRISPVVYKIFN